MERKRAALGFVNDLDDFNPTEWAVGAPAQTPPEAQASRKAAEDLGFRSREVASLSADTAGGAGGAKPVRRRRTGRNAQFNLKARPDTIEDFCAVADANGWGLGETLEYAVSLLQREYGKSSA